MKLVFRFMLSAIVILLASAIYFAMKTKNTSTTLVVITSKWMDTPYSPIQMIDRTKNSKYLIKYVPPGPRWEEHEMEIPKAMWDTINIPKGGSYYGQIPNEWLEK